LFPHYPSYSGIRITLTILFGTGTKNALLARDPEFFVADREVVNFQYYMKKQLQGPLERLMNPIYGRKVVLDMFRLSS